MSLGFIILYAVLLIIALIPTAVSAWLAFGDRIKPYFLIRFSMLPTYKKLEAKYNAKYPTIMNEIYSPFDELSIFDNYKAFFFATDNCFKIISPKRPELKIEIPFSNILCHRNYIHNEKRNTHYTILFQLCIDIADTPKWLTFENLSYNHKIDKKYGNRLNGKDLYKFICENFMNEDEYKVLNPHIEL